MAKAQQMGGLYYLPDGTAVDADGKVLSDAPPRPANTDPSKQPGQAAAVTMEERVASAVATALSGGGAQTIPPVTVSESGEAEDRPGKAARAAK